MEPKKKIYPEWSVGYTSDEKATPLKFFPATVPGATQLDIARAMKYGDYRQSDNYTLYKWHGRLLFHLSNSVSLPGDKSGRTGAIRIERHRLPF